MLEDSAVLGTGGGGASADAVSAAPVVADAAVPASAEAHDGGDDGGGRGSNSGEDERGRVEEGDKSFGGNRWPRQETLALLKIRSDMDVAFRDASVKGPLWEEVSRKLAELGYHRNAKKCKEKFENVYKYHKRTKEGRSGKSEGKTYRFFDQLQALEKNPAVHGIQSPTPVSIVVTTTTTPSSTTMSNNTTTVPSTTTSSSLTLPQAILNITPPSTLPSNPTTYFPTQTPNPTSNNNNNNIGTSPNSLSNSSSFSTSSEETTTTTMGGKRKRKWKEFFERLMKEVVEKQEELQRRFLEAIEKREQERVVREEAWRMQEMQRINREREILAQERSISAAKDAAVMAFLQKIAQHQQQEVNLEPALNNNNNIIIAPQQQVPQATPNSTPQPEQTRTVPEAPQVQPLVPQTQPQHHQQVVNNANVEINKADDNNNNDNKGESLMMGGSSSRWPKVEVQALIDLRTNLETKYQETGPKGPLWEEISALMRKMGYNRNAKRCKEKWENINKYFKKVKESNKKRPQDSKTCPYFHQLEALYREKGKVETQMKPPSIMMAPLMVQPEQQWPPQHHVMPPEVTMGDASNDPMVRQHHEDEAEEDEDNKEVRNDNEEEEDDEDEEEEGDGNYEIVASKPPSGEE